MRVQYNSGDGIFAPLEEDDLTFGTAQYIKFPTTSEPANVSHPHMVLEYKNEVFIPDLVSAIVEVPT